MSNFTIVIQGNIQNECVEANIRNSMGIPVVVSTWEGQEYSGSVEPKILTKTKQPECRGIHNFRLQLISTIEGLKSADTKYVIKVRGDEFYNYSKVVEAVAFNDMKIYTSSLFFRPFSFIPYHFSDHIIAGRTEHIRKMFEDAKKKYDDGMDHDDSKEWGLTKAHMRNMGFHDFGNHEQGKEAMKKMFGILREKDLRPYKMTCNMFGKVFLNNFNHADWGSIEDMGDL